MAQGDLLNQLLHIAELIYPLEIPAVIVYTAMPPKDLFEITDEVLNTHDNIEIFVSEPQRKGKTKGLYTGFEDGTLIIVQRLDLLIKSREQAKNQGYYAQKTLDE